MELLLGPPPASWTRAAPASVRASSGAVYTLHAVPAHVVERPAQLLVLRAAGGFVTEGPGLSAVVDPAAAMPVLVYRVDAASLVLHVPCGAHDAHGTWTFLAPDMRYVGASFDSAPRWPSSSAL